MRDKPTARNIDAYLAALPEAQRDVLQRLRKTIHAAVPRAEECRLDGRPLVHFGASAGHCSFYPGSGTAVEAHQKELAGYSTSKGTIRFQPDKPLPASLVRRLVRYRIAEHAS